jgi:hypothetical protein
MFTFGEQIAILTEDEGPTNRHHEILVSALYYNCAFSLVVGLLEIMSYFGTPDSIGVVYHMV